MQLVVQQQLSLTLVHMYLSAPAHFVPPGMMSVWCLVNLVFTISLMLCINRFMLLFTILAFHDD
jgi:hypothetical protein